MHSWISHGHYDFKYTSAQFFEKLGTVLGVSKEDIKLALYEQKLSQKELNRFQNCYIFIETNFKRAETPIFVLACLSNARRLALPIEKLVFKTDKEIFERVSKIIIEHYKSTKGKLLIFGNIAHYQYHHTDNKVYNFGRDGKEIKCDITNESKATLSIAGRVLC